MAVIDYFLVMPGLDPGIQSYLRCEMPYYVYIMANRRNGALYVGVTNDLIRRTYEHKIGDIPGFTKRYGVKHLVHFEIYEDVRQAIQREKNVKHWSRKWKLALIEKDNPEWRDLYDEIAA